MQALGLMSVSRGGGGWGGVAVRCRQENWKVKSGIEDEEAREGKSVGCGY